MAIADGIYELRTVLQTDLAVDVSGGSSTKGANVQLYGANGTNAQKFRIIDEGGSWSIENIASSMFIDVAGGSATSGTNVQQWTDNDTRAQRWTISETGSTATVEGMECPVVTIGSMVDGTGTALMMDVRGAMTTNKANIWIYRANGSAAQQWALFPTDVLDRTIPAPASVGWSATVGEAAQEVLPAAAQLFPSWSFSPAWAPVGSNGFEFRFRSRLVEAGTLDSGSCGSWGAWAAAPVTVRGQRAWLTSGIPADFDAASCKALEVQLQVRSTSSAGADPAHGLAVTKTLRSVAPVTVAFSAAEIGPEGIALAYASTYAGGTVSIAVQSVKKDGTELLAAPATVYGAAQEGTVDIAYGAMRALVEPGDELDVTYTVGTDQYAGDGSTATATVTAAYAGGRTGDLAATVEQGAGRVLDVDAGASGIAAAWIAYPRGIQTAIPLGGGTFAAPYPFGEDCTLLITSRNAAGTEWESTTLDYAAGFDGLKPVHAFNWKGGAFLIEVNAGAPISTEINIRADADAVAYSGRAWETYAYGTAKDGGFTAVGIIDALTASTVAELDALIEAGHVVYRAPSGEIFAAAVTSVAYSAGPDGSTAVTVTGSREAV